MQGIFAGAYFLDSGHYEGVLERYEKSGTFQWLPIPQRYFDRFQKNDDYSFDFRSRGNQAYQSKQIATAFRFYNLALCFAHPNSEQESLAYANRAALFIHIKEYTLALRDLDLVSCVLDEKIVEKLTMRRRKCEGKVGQSQSQEFCEKLMKTKVKNGKVRGAQGFVQIQFDKQCGRKLIVSEDVGVGTALLVDGGYATVLDKLLNWDTEHCGSCAKAILGGVAHPMTSFGMYCDEECLSKSTTDTDIYNYIHCTEQLHDCLIILEILLKTGSKLVKELYQTEDTYDPASYKSVINLIQHDPSPTDHFKSLVLTELLAQTTTFFENTTSNFKQFTTSLIKIHLSSLPYNILTLSEWRSPSGPLSLKMYHTEAKQLCQKVSVKSYALGVYPLVALTNHSCDPNAVFLKGTRTSGSCLIASRNIRSGEEITISYNQPFTRQGFADRRQYLLSNYKFVCNCFACANKLSASTKYNKSSGGVQIGVKFEFCKRLLKEERFLEAYGIVLEQIGLLDGVRRDEELVQVGQELFREIVVCLAMF